MICDEFERPKRDLLRLHATVYVEREGQKGILVGKGGEMIKRIGIERAVTWSACSAAACTWGWTLRSSRIGARTPARSAALLRRR